MRFCEKSNFGKFFCYISYMVSKIQYHTFAGTRRFISRNCARFLLLQTIGCKLIMGPLILTTFCEWIAQNGTPENYDSNAPFYYLMVGQMLASKIAPNITIKLWLIEHRYSLSQRNPCITWLRQNLCLVTYTPLTFVI